MGFGIRKQGGQGLPGAQREPVDHAVKTPLTAFVPQIQVGDVTPGKFAGLGRRGHDPNPQKSYPTRLPR